MYVVGDRLQSLQYHDNALTHLQKISKSALMNVIKCEESNVVRRFGNQRLVDFVNKVIPFVSNGLPNMTCALDIDKCTDPKCITVFEAVSKVYANMRTHDMKIVSAVEQIMTLFDAEVIEKNSVT